MDGSCPSGNDTAAISLPGGHARKGLKKKSSKWIKGLAPDYRHYFYWQRGYGAFSVSPSQKQRARLSRAFGARSEAVNIPGARTVQSPRGGGGDHGQRAAPQRCHDAPQPRGKGFAGNSGAAPPQEYPHHGALHPRRLRADPADGEGAQPDFGVKRAGGSKRGSECPWRNSMAFSRQLFLLFHPPKVGFD